MSSDKFRHYFPGVEYNWPSEAEYETLTVEGMEKPSQAEFDALPWPPVPTLNEAKAARLTELAAIRWEHQSAGIIVPYGGQNVRVPTGENDVVQADMAQRRAEKDAGYTRDIKLANGLFITANAAIIITVGNVIDAHLQACFSREKALTALILAAASVEAVQAIDLTVGWP